MSRRRSNSSKTSNSENQASLPAKKHRRLPPRHVGRRRDRNLLEELENRILFNTIITDTDPLTATPDTATFEYKDARGQDVRIAVHGDVQAEFAFAKVSKDGTVVVRDAVSITKLDDKGKLVANDEDGRDLFHVYIQSASIDSFISIAKINGAFDAKARPMDPYSGGVTLRITPNAGQETTKTTTGGSVLLGARTRSDIMPDEAKDIPIRVISGFQGLGLIAKPANHKLIAGITTAPGVSIGKFMFGGAVTGEVRFNGSVETFYCGTLLTGTTEGQFEGIALDPGNFFVQGDIRNIITLGAMGTHDLANDNDGRRLPTYFTGTDFDIHGRVGQIKCGGDYLATGIIHNDNPGLGLRTRQQELEFRIDPSINRGSITDFEQGIFGDNQAFFFNDDFASAQYLGSINSKQLGENAIQLNGTFQRSGIRVTDLGDFYAVGLMAGQNITVRLIAPDTFNAGTAFETKSILHAGVFDPDKRLIASDYSDVSDTTALGPAAVANRGAGGTVTVGGAVDFDPLQQELFSFTATKPGIYYIAVGETAPTFNTTPLIGIEQPYQLQVTGVGNMGLGGLVTSDTIYAPTSFAFTTGVGGGFVQQKVRSVTGFSANIDVENGDLGAVTSLNDFIIDTSDFGFNTLVDTGNLRAFDAVSLGFALGRDATTNGLTLTSAAQIGVTKGSVGMIRSTGTGADVDTTLINTLGRGASQFGFPTIIGGDIQYIVSPTNLITDLECNGNIGVVQAAQFGVSNYAGSLSCNVDGDAKGGIIDLIDVTGDLGTLQAGGPTISTNQGGNVRYIHVADTSTIYRPLLFGGGQPETTTFVQGQSADFTDDSGTSVHITPTIDILRNPTTGLPIFDANGAPITNSGTLTVETYPIARAINDTGGGGLVIVRVSSTRGVLINTTGTSAEIGTVTVGTADAGPGLVAQTNGLGVPSAGPDGIVGTGDDPFVLDPLSSDTQSVDIRGDRTDIFSMQGANTAFIRNRTTGEIVNTRIGTTALLEAESLGVARSSVVPGMDVEGGAVADNPGTTGVDGSTFPFDNAKNAISINGGSETGFAAIDVRSRTAIGNVMIAGRVQNLVANSDNKGVKGFEGIVGAVWVQGQLRNVQIGEGILPSGTGSFARAGLYADAVNVTTPATGLGRIENIQNQGLNSDIRGNIVAAGGIGTINLRDGSIINANIVTYLSSGRNGTHTGTGADFTASREFGDFVVINTAANIDKVSVIGAGGIIGTSFSTANVGPVTSTGGFGIVNSEFGALGAGRFGTVTADGLGIRGVIWRGGQSLDGLTANGNGHRLTTTSFEPGVIMSPLAKIDPFFGFRPNALTDLFVVTNTTPEAPQRKGTSASGSIDLSLIQVSRDVGFVKANTIRAAEFRVPNKITSLETGDYVDSLVLTAGRMDKMTIGKDAHRSNISIAGPVGDVTIGGAFRGSSRFAASGPNGSINSFTTGRTLYGNVSATKNIGSIIVGTHYGSQGTHAGGDLGSFSTGGDFSTGALLSVTKSLDKLLIGGDFQSGSTVKAGVLGTKTVIGADDGKVVIG